MCSRVGNSKVNGQIWPEFEIKDFTPVLVICKFDDDPIKDNKRASMQTPSSHYKPMGIFLDAQRQLTP